VGLIARGLEMAGIAATLTSWHAGIIRRTAPPRAVITRLPRGSTMGHPHHIQQQQTVLEAALALLEKDAPQAPTYLDEQ
jgi:hypothetical protein